MMRTFRLLLVGAVLTLAAHIAVAEDPVAGVNLHLLTSGENDTIAYALYNLPSKQKEVDLVLIIRNTGAKWIDADGVDGAYFALADGNGKVLKIWRVTGMDGIAYQSVALVHIYVQGPLSENQEYTLELRPKPKVFVPIKFKTKPFRLN